MKKFSLGAAAATAALFFTASSAEAGIPYGSYEELTFVAETGVYAPSGDTTLSLCRISTKHHVGFIGFWRNDAAYVLSESQCLEDGFYRISQEDMTAYQETGLIAPEVPAAPTLTAQEIATGFSGTFLLVLALFFKAAIELREFVSRRRRTGSNTAAINTLAAMCHIAKADGEIDPAEIEMIGAVIFDKTGRQFSIQQIAQMIELTEDTLDPEDYAGFGEGLTEHERERLIEAALIVAVADGEIHPAEHSLMMNLARGLNIPAAKFRKALQSVAEELAGLSPSASADPA